jgi:neutral ceramidase
MWLKFALTGYLCIAVSLVVASSQAAESSGWKAGVASVDITPDYPVRLSGYGSRATPHEGVEMRLHAKALTLTWEDTPPAVILTVDNCGVPATIRAEVLNRLKKAGHTVEDARFSLHSSHTHCAPALPGLLPFLFQTEFTAEENTAIQRYAEDLTKNLTQVVLAALSKQEPAKLDWSSGKVRFAMNRRLKTPTGYTNSPNPYGPVDHSLPVLRITDAQGKLRAIYTSYACHCTTLSINKIHPDWAGAAQKELELRFPGVIALTAIGCGADQNPYPRRELVHAIGHGADLAKEAVRVINEPMKSIKGPITCNTKEIKLPFDTPRDEASWRQLTEDKNKWVARHAEYFLSKLEKKEAIPSSLPYFIQVWAFGKDLLTINLPGEVVVDYGLRFKKENDPERTWVNSYTNDVPCYIPSQRVWEEGGYEAAGAMVYYGRPNRFASGIEEIIARTVQELVPASFVKTAEPNK